ncbi:MAG: hypothetical protein GY822_13580 [Deltaproteobacteria bacterium]|nr:hypothetical protein [Deltaproteobacteria bacterium]
MKNQCRRSGAGKSQVGIDEMDELLRSMPQDLALADTGALVGKTGENLVDHNEISYQVSTSRNHGVDLK